MDNVKIHHGDEIGELLECFGTFAIAHSRSLLMFS
jgi:hypothetical protein